MIPYDIMTYNNPNLIARFAHRTRHKVSLQLAQSLLPKNGVVVDFGAGDGLFVHNIQQARPDIHATAIEPNTELRYPNIRRLINIEDIKEGSVDLICAFEVAEHLADEDLTAFFVGSRKALTTRGHLLITVPIMYGLALPVKELQRMILHKRWTDTGAVDMFKGILGISIPRAHNRHTSHKGFDFRWLRNQLSTHFRVTQEFYSPFRHLPWWVNSQAVFVAE